MGRIFSSSFSPPRKDLSPDGNQSRAEIQVPWEQQTTQSGRVETGQDQADLARVEPGVGVAIEEARMRPEIAKRNLG